MWCRGRVTRRAPPQRVKTDIGVSRAQSTVPVRVGRPGPKPGRDPRPQGRRGHPLLAPSAAPLPRKARSRVESPPDRRGGPPGLLLGHDVSPGQTCSRESSESKLSNVSAEIQCGCWPSLPSPRSQNAFSRAWASRPEHRLSRARAHRTSPQTPLLQISIRRRPTTGTLAPDPLDERASPIPILQRTPSPEGIAVRAIGLEAAAGESHTGIGVRGALKSSRIGTISP